MTGNRFRLQMFLAKHMLSVGGRGGGKEEGGRTNERPGTDHVISGPKKMHPMAQTDRHPDRQTDGHGDSTTESAQWGRFSEKISLLISKSCTMHGSWNQNILIFSSG